MLKRATMALCIMAAAAGAANAQGACPLTYAVFEFAVPHLDLQSCPADLARKDAFCRASAGNDAVHVFVFAEKGEQCLLAAKSYKDGEYRLSLK
jgi:hypothetical protein